MKESTRRRGRMGPAWVRRRDRRRKHRRRRPPRRRGGERTSRAGRACSVGNRSRQSDGQSRKAERMSNFHLLAEMTGNVHVGLAALGGAIGVGLIGMKASDAVGRNPGAATKVL